jgi:pimeloyl-ACP methyl ester carboxylesterase
VSHYDRIIRELDSPPIIMGHSFGGLFAQLLAYRGFGVAAVGIHPGAPAGVLTLPFSPLKAGAQVLANPLNIGGATILTPDCTVTAAIATSLAFVELRCRAPRKANETVGVTLPVGGPRPN